MPDALTAAAPDLPVTGYGRNASAQNTPPQTTQSATDAALQVLKLAPEIILGAHLSGLKSGDALQGRFVVQDHTLLLVTERGVFAVAPAKELPTTGAVAVQIVSIGRTLQAVTQNLPVPQQVTLTLIALPPQPEKINLPTVETVAQAQQIAREIATAAPALAAALRILPEQSAFLDSALPVARLSLPEKAAPAPQTLISFVFNDTPDAPPLLGTLVAVLEGGTEALPASGPLAKLLATARAALVQVLPEPDSAGRIIAELVQAGKLPLRIILPETLKLAPKSQAIILLARASESVHEQVAATLAKVPADGAGFIHERLPAPGPKLAAQLALFFNLAGQNAAPEFLPAVKERQQYLQAFTDLRSLETLGDTQKITVPLRLYGEAVPLQFTLYAPEQKVDPDGGQASVHASDHLFDVAVTFPEIGMVQLTGIYHAANLSLTVRTENPLPEALAAELAGVYGAVLGQEGWTGTLRFS